MTRSSRMPSRGTATFVLSILCVCSGRLDARNFNGFLPIM